MAIATGCIIASNKNSVKARNFTLRTQQDKKRFQTGPNQACGRVYGEAHTGILREQ
jgi:hypothetical protein